MGSEVEINDTLQITLDQGFPEGVLNIDAHLKSPITLQHVSDKIFHFYRKPGARLFQLPPVRVYLVQNINGKWLFWGKVLIIEQTISQRLLDAESSLPGDWQTSGKYKVLDVYDPAYQEAFTRRESPPGLSFFG